MSTQILIQDSSHAWNYTLVKANTETFKPPPLPSPNRHRESGDGEISIERTLLLSCVNCVKVSTFHSIFYSWFCYSKIWVSALMGCFRDLVGAAVFICFLLLYACFFNIQSHIYIYILFYFHFQPVNIFHTSVVCKICTTFVVVVFSSVE